MPDIVSMLSVEGVLGHRSDSYAAMLPIRPGLSLFRGLREMGRIVLSSSHDKREEVTYWLKLNGITSDDFEILFTRRVQDTDMDDVSLRVDHLSRVRAQKYSLNLYVDADPEVVARAFNMGVVSLLFAHPNYMRPEHRPGVHVGPNWWSEISTSAARQRELIAEHREVQYDKRN